MSERMGRQKIAGILGSGTSGQKVEVKGWVRTRRDSKGGFSFLELNDGSCLQNIQVVAPAALSNYESDVLHIHQGASVAVMGTVTPSQGKKQGVEIQADSIRILGASDAQAYPIGKQKMSFEYLREVAHLRGRTNTFGAIARVRNVLSSAVHEFFQTRGFLWIHTPIITSNDAEGAGKTFQVTTLDLEKPPRNEAGVDFSQDFFGNRANLTVSGQLEAESYALSLGDVYTFGPTFRAENSHTSRHLAEFWMVEPEMAFADLEDDIELAEAFLKFLFKTVLERCPEDMEFFRQRIDATVVDTLTAIAASDFKRLTYTEAIAILEKESGRFQFPVHWGVDLQSEHERFLTEEVFKVPVVLTDYPKGIKAFYMKVNDDGETVRAMDVLLPKIGEIIGGSQREEREEVLKTRMAESSVPPEGLDWYLDLRRFGSVPHAGFGLGFERLVQFVTGMANIRDVIPFPRTPGNLRY